MQQEKKILVGTISGAHGVKGHVRLKSFTDDPASITKYKPLIDESGKREFAIKVLSSTNNYFVAEISGVTDRDAAEALRNTKLFVPRAALPKLKKREFYESDLVGLAAQDEKGKIVGKVIAVHNYGGGPFLEIGHTPKEALMLPFNKTCVPGVNVDDGYIVIDPPDKWL